jgi:hypothetical protein
MSDIKNIIHNIKQTFETGKKFTAPKGGLVGVFISKRTISLFV